MIKVYPDTEKRKEALRVLSDCKDNGMSYTDALANVQKTISGGNWENIPVIHETGKKAGKHQVEKRKSQDGKKAARTDGKKKSGSDPHEKKACSDPVKGKRKPSVESVTVSPADIIPMDNTAVFNPSRDDLTVSEEIQKKIQFYATETERLTNLYIDTILDGDIKTPNKWFPDLIYYISDRLPKPERDITLLDGLFSVYTRLCSRVKILPTIEHFITFVSIPHSTFYDWRDGKAQKLTPAFTDTIKKWGKVCERALIADVRTSEGASVNKIFVLKAAYGWSEAPQTQRVEVVGAAPANYPVLGQSE